MVCINSEVLLAHLDYAGHRVHHRAIEPFPDPLEEAADAALLQALAGGPLFELVSDLTGHNLIFAPPAAWSRCR